MASDVPTRPIDLNAERELADILALAFGSGSREDYDALNRVVQDLGTLLTEKWSLGSDHGGFGLPMRTLIESVLSRIRREGSEFTRRAIVAFYVALPWNRDLRVWVATYLPDQAAAVSEADFGAAEARKQLERVAVVAKAVQEIGSGPAELEAGELESLTQVANKLGRLRAYKGIHDALHDVQTRAYTQLTPFLAKDVQVTPADQEAIYGWVGELETARQNMEASLVPLREEWAADGSLPSWLIDLDGAIERLRTLPFDIERVRAGIYALRFVLRDRMPRVAGKMIDTARGLPLEKVIEVIKRTAETPAASSPLLVAGAADLTALHLALTRMLAAHEAWQQVDSVLWQLEQEINPDAAKSDLAAVRAHWEMLAEKLAVVRDVSPEAWDSALDLSYTTISATLGGLSSLDRDVALKLQEFVRHVRMRFRGIDTQILKLCNGISRLGAPIQALIDGYRT